MKVCLYCNDYEELELKVLRTVRNVHLNLRILDIRKTDFGLFKDMFGSRVQQGPGGKRDPTVS